MVLGEGRTVDAGEAADPGRAPRGGPCAGGGGAGVGDDERQPVHPGVVVAVGHQLGDVEEFLVQDPGGDIRRGRLGVHVQVLADRAGVGGDGLTVRAGHRSGAGACTTGRDNHLVAGDQGDGTGPGLCRRGSRAERTGRGRALCSRWGLCACGCRDREGQQYRSDAERRQPRSSGGYGRQCEFLHALRGQSCWGNALVPGQPYGVPQSGTAQLRHADNCGHRGSAHVARPRFVDLTRTRGARRTFRHARSPRTTGDGRGRWAQLPLRSIRSRRDSA